MNPILTIAIPTFNRGSKLRRLLCAIRNEIMVSHIGWKVVVMVSDNASADETPKVVEEFGDSGFELTYHRQSDNLGFDGNIRYLYLHTQTPYIWYIADDDLPLIGAVAKVVTALETYDPDILLFSFIQPPGSTVRQFNYPDPIYLVKGAFSAIKHVLRNPKLSIYVMRKVNFDASQWNILDKNLGCHWYFIPLAFSVLETSPKPLLAAISEPLATCDEDYIRLGGVPSAFLRMDEMLKHPFVLKHNPSLSKIYKNKGYCQAIQFSFAVKCGSLLPERMEEYDQFINDLECRIPTLLRHPRSLIQFIALKLRIASLWPKIRPIIRRIKPRPASGKIEC